MLINENFGVIGMFYSKRHEDILNILKEKGSVSVHYLSKALFVSEPTVRRDLTELEAEGKIRRTFGGAVASELLNREVPLSMRENTQKDAKRKIAADAACEIYDGQVIFLDASSTAFYLVEHIASYKDVTVITNGPKTSLALAERKIRSFSTGGLMLENAIAYVGKSAEDFVKNFNADIFFFSCRGLSLGGELTDSSMEESELRKVMMSHSKRNVYLCTSDKIGKKYMYNLCNVEDTDKVYCDDKSRISGI